MNDKLLRENERDLSAGLINIVPRAQQKDHGKWSLSLSLSTLKRDENFLRNHHLCRQEKKLDRKVMK